MARQCVIVGRCGASPRHSRDRRTRRIAPGNRRLAAHRGKQKATIAVGHSLLVIAYQLLAHGHQYDDLGANYLDERDRQLVQRRLVRMGRGTPVAERIDALWASSGPEKG